MLLERLQQRFLMATYVVSPAGDDSNPGSESAPWQTLQHAALKVQAGDSVTVRRGKYIGFCLGWDTQPVGTRDAPIVFKADPGVEIIANNNKTRDGINIENSAWVVIDGFTVNDRLGKGGIYRAGVRIANAPNSVVRNVISKNNGNWGIYATHSDDVTIENCIALRNNANRPDDFNHHGIYVANSSQRPVIRNNVVAGNYGNGIHLNGDASQGGAGVITGAVIENNTIIGNGRNGGSAINCDGLEHSIIRNNTLTENYGKGISLYQIDAAAASVNNLVSGNTVIMAADPRGPALQIKNGSSGNVVRSNNLSSPKGAMQVADDGSLEGFRSDRNLFRGSFSIDDGTTPMSLGTWKNQTGQDLHSKMKRRKNAPASAVSSQPLSPSRAVAHHAV